MEWINEGMHADKKKQSALQALRNIIRAAGNPQEMKSIYKMIEQHADHGYPVDDRWKTIEEFKDQENIVRIEVVKNTYDSLAFLESVTKTKLNTNNDDILYVVHLEHIPYEDEEKTMYAHQWTMDTVKALQTQYPETKYLLACSPLVDRFFSPEEIYAMQESFQHDTRIYRDGIAQGNLLIGDKVIRL